MRAEQWIGLNDRAKALVKPNLNKFLYHEVGTRFYADGTKQDYDFEQYGSDIVQHVYRIYEGAFEGEHQLNGYTFSNGEEWYEEIQLEPWSSGPMTFLALKRKADDSWVKESLWTVADIEAVESGLVDEDSVKVEGDVR